MTMTIILLLICQVWISKLGRVRAFVEANEMRYPSACAPDPKVRQLGQWVSASAEKHRALCTLLTTLPHYALLPLEKT